MYPPPPESSSSGTEAHGTHSQILFVSELHHCVILTEEQVNATSMPQPRRKSWSVLIASEKREAETVHRLFSYSQSYRPVEDWRGEAMPLPIFHLGVECWRRAWSYLSPISQVCPPTGCQLLAYHTLFGSTINRHRDNGLLVPGGKHSRLGNSEDENSQIRGSSVLVFSRGAPMTFALSSPPSGKLPWTVTKDEYEIQPALTLSLEDGTLYVLDPRDDENHCHEAWFESDIIARGAHVRCAYVFRWLSKQHVFYVDRKGPESNAVVTE